MYVCILQVNKLKLLYFCSNLFFTVDDYLPTEIPSLIIRIPDNYPTVPPEYIMNGYKNSSFLLSIEQYVGKQLTNMNLYSVTQLLHVWVSDDGIVCNNIIICCLSCRNPVYVMQSKTLLL